jgi:outer membrane receptor for ferric coprogen and ferric-rhodotorulic acid
MMSSPVAASAGNTWIGSASPDTAFIDHVEIQQGAAGLLIGAGQPGGTLNMVRKLPTESFMAQAEVGLGSWDRRRLVGDISGPLTQSGVLRGRAVLLSEDGNSYVDYGFMDKKGFYGVIEALPTDKTKIGLSLQYQKSRFNENLSGHPTAVDGSDLKLSRSTLFGWTNDRVKSEDTYVSLYLEHQLSENWLLRGAYSHSIGKLDIVRTSIYNNNNGLDLATGDGLFAAGWREPVKRTGDALDLYARGAENLFGRRHEFAFGFNGSRVKGWRGGARSDLVYFNLYTYHPSMMPHVDAHVSLDDVAPNKTRQYGIWGVARLNLTDSLKLILGTRVSWYGYWNDRGVQTMEETGVVSPYGGLVYDLNKQLSVYASYSDIFNPQTAMDRSGNVLEPVVGANYEVGIKGEFLNKRLNTAAAIFRLEQTNLAAQDTDFGNPNGVCSGWCSIAQGKVISEGVDLSVNGALSSNWNVGAGYTYSKSEYATGSQNGDRYGPENPIHAFRLSTTYRIPGTGWMVGGNLRAQSSIYREQGGGLFDASENQAKRLYPAGPDGEIPDQRARGTQHHRRQRARQKVSLSHEYKFYAVRRPKAGVCEFEGCVLSGQGKDMGAFAPHFVIASAARQSSGAYLCDVLFARATACFSLPRPAGESAPAGAREQPCSQSSILCGQC